MMEVNRQRVTRDMSFTEFLSSLAFAVKIVKSLVPTAYQQVGSLVLICDGAPLHAPNSCIQLDFILNKRRATF